MANDIGHNPWLIDTAGATAILSSTVPIVRVLWDEPSTNGHEAIITDKDGNVIWRYRALAAGNGIQYVADIDVNAKGVFVPTLDSGNLYIYIK